MFFSFFRNPSLANCVASACVCSVGMLSLVLARLMLISFSESTSLSSFPRYILLLPLNFSTLGFTNCNVGFLHAFLIGHCVHAGFCAWQSIAPKSMRALYHSRDFPCGSSLRISSLVRTFPLIRESAR